jgi:hypothetical protein
VPFIVGEIGISLQTDAFRGFYTSRSIQSKGNRGPLPTGPFRMCPLPTGAFKVGEIGSLYQQGHLE